MEIQARAKINWTLDVVGKRPDGYHLLDSLMQPLALCDTLLLEPADALTLTLAGADGLSAGPDNLALQAAEALRQAAGIHSGANMLLTKRIPMGAGLGGGSADAAAALRGLNRLWALNFPLETLCEIGLRLGADIPFCLMDRPMRAQGIGERLQPIACGRCFPLVLVQPCAALSTREVFAAYHASSVRPPDTALALRGLAAGRLDWLQDGMGNALEQASIPLRPGIAEAKQALLEAGAVLAQMTGSGSVVFGAFASASAAQIACRKLRNRFPVCILTETAL